ncbi:hypothetical protein HII31_12998 [Pseudocercospora fuligena]|uniref:Uncharacterized protein n=1 Tax=Pseudocercospora fuligena TaxID=685502 RepID=A0A8H6R886_9PEZI|nr:hypothetical protein HII31_12998 [Pseudocercospora fuligena]
MRRKTHSLTYRKPVGAVQAFRTRAWCRTGRSGHGASFKLAIARKMLAMMWFAYSFKQVKRGCCTVACYSSRAFTVHDLERALVKVFARDANPEAALRAPESSSASPMFLGTASRASWTRGFQDSPLLSTTSQHTHFNMAEPPRGPTDHNMSPSRHPRSVHPGQSPAPLQSRPSSTAPNHFQAPPTAVPATHGLGPSTGQQGQHVSAAQYEMRPPLPPLPHPARATAYNPAPPSGPPVQHVPATPNVIGSPLRPLPHPSRASQADGTRAHNTGSSGGQHVPPMPNMGAPPLPFQGQYPPGPAPFMVPDHMRLNMPTLPAEWEAMGMTPPGTPFRRLPLGRQTNGTHPVSPHEARPDGRASSVGFGPGFGGARPPSASPSHGAVSQHVAAVQSGLISRADASSPLRNSRPTPTVVAGPDPPSDSSLQGNRRPSSTLRIAATPDQASGQHHANYMQQQPRPPLSATNISQPQHGIWSRENQEPTTTAQTASPLGQSTFQHHQNLLPQQVQRSVPAVNNSDAQNSMPPPENRRLPADTQNASPTGQAEAPAMINSSSQSDVQNPQGAPGASSSLSRRADSMLPASEPARKRQRLDGAFSPAHPSSASDLPAACTSETSGDGAAASQGSRPQPPGLKDFLQKRQEDARAEGKTSAVIREAPPVQDAEQPSPLDRNCAVCGLDLGDSRVPALLAARLDHLELCMQRETALVSSGPPNVPLADFWSKERMVRSFSTSDLETDMVSNHIQLQKSFDEAYKVYQDPATSIAWKQSQRPSLQQAESDINRTNRDFPMRDETRELVFKRMAAASEEKKERKELVARAFEYGADQNGTLAPESKDKLEEIPKNRGE